MNAVRFLKSNASSYDGFSLKERLRDSIWLFSGHLGTGRRMLAAEGF